MASAHDVGIAHPAEFAFDRLISLLLQARAPHDIRTEHSEEKTAHMRPVSYRRELAMRRSVKQLRNQPNQ
jgi:hypothetical protein